MNIKQIAAGALGALLLGVVGLVGFVQTRPDVLTVSSTLEVAASPDDVRPFARDLQEWNRWSPWSDIDPQVKAAFSEPSAGLGAWYSWEGNDEVGKGKMTVKADQPLKVVHEIAFEKPMEDVALSTITWSGDDDKTTITWSFSQEAGFGTKAANLVMDIEGMLTKDYDKGLGRLKPLVEAAAKQRIASEKQEEAEALVRAAEVAAVAADEAAQAAAKALEEAAKASEAAR